MKKLKAAIKEILEIFLPAIIISYLLSNFVFMTCQVDGTSMYPNLQDGDRGFSSIISIKFSIERFDTVVIDLGDKLLVKRVIGLPGEEVEYRDNQLYINGELVSDEYGYGNTSDFSIVLNDDEYYCLGDNRQVSRDSRYYGPFNENRIRASHLLIFYPLKDFGYYK